MKILPFYQKCEGFDEIVSAVPKMAKGNAQHIGATVYNSSGKSIYREFKF
jgi:hypothetical protein